MFLKLLLSFCQPFLHGWSWKTQHLLDVVQLSRSWELKVSRGWWIPASSCSMEKDDPMCLGCFCARAAGLCEAPAMCHLCCRVHTSTLQPRDLGLVAHSHPARLLALSQGLPNSLQPEIWANTAQRGKEDKMGASDSIWVVFARQFSPPCDPELCRQWGVLVRFQGWGWGCVTVVTGAEGPLIPGSSIRHQGCGRQEDR